MIIKIFEISTKKMYVFPNKAEFFKFLQNVADKPVFYNKTIPQLIKCLPAHEYCQI